MPAPTLRKNWDWSLLIITYMTAIFGVITLFSATSGDKTNYAKSQLIFLSVATLALLAGSHINYHRYERFVRHFYIANLLLLLYVWLKGHGAKGAVRWIKIGGFQFQPSELAKIVLILSLAHYLIAHKDEIRSLWGLVKSFLLIAIPAVIIIKQPDLGTGLVVIAVWFGMSFLAGARIKHLALFALCGLLAFTVLWKAGVIKDYQKARIAVFIDPEHDVDGAGYHVAQARIAIGSGGTWGKGLLKGKTVRGGFIPEKQTDFVFTTVGEEMGLVGGLGLLTLYASLLWRIRAVIMASHEDELGKLLGTGIATMFAFHIIVNLGMNVGILPVTGVPLPFVSAGGSNLILFFFCIGILQSIMINRRDLLFG
jgi:rod shape determining protein RodA